MIHMKKIHRGNYKQLTFLPSSEYIALTPLGRVTLSTKTLVKSAVRLSKDLQFKNNVIRIILLDQ